MKRNKIMAVVKFNDGEAYVLKRRPKYSYVKSPNGQAIVGRDGPFCQCYYYDRPSPGWEAFGGRKFDITLHDGTVEHCHGQWWHGINADAKAIMGGEPLVNVTWETIDELRRCYVFGGAFVIKAELEKLRKRYRGKVYEYWEYEKIIKAMGKPT